MSEKVAMTIEVTPEERERINQLATQHGFTQPGDYLLSLVGLDQDELTKDELLANLRESIREAENGQIIPASEFLAALEDDD